MYYVTGFQPFRDDDRTYPWGFTPCGYACRPLALQNGSAYSRDSRMSAKVAATYQPRLMAWVSYAFFFRRTESP